MDADRGGQHRNLTCQRLEYRQPEALSFGWDQDGVGGIDPKGDTIGVDSTEGEQLYPHGLGEFDSAIVALLGAGGIGGEQ
jgi:hypothetical protein